MTVQPDLCQTCSETTLLVFPRGGSFYSLTLHFSISCMPGLGKQGGGVSLLGACFECLHLCKSQSMTVLETEKELNDLCMQLE